ncbi:hypothetical protein [Burkholderia sp. Tr-20390]|uniref:hypothetical protein n=1 Tax=Burkholderia sp. Tr-20390 TaxID=2703904 RepID=UPI0019801CE6|nr:hypothetical protein [Burkholderia sp. Tr-20390]MBN3729500.1 hypothetical protein [Burkholderia sp. Tr-20390]
MAHPSSSTVGWAEELFRRIGNAEHVVRTGYYTNGHVGRRGMCHENVAQWLQEHPCDRPVRGWLVDQSQLQYGFIDFHAHSVVDVAGGGLQDVTLGVCDPDYEFLRDERSDEEFLTHARAKPTLRHVVDQVRYDAFQLALENPYFSGGLDSEE